MKSKSRFRLFQFIYFIGHGTSVGSLGQFAGEVDIVENVMVENIVMANAQNGARIKVFGGNPSPTSISGGGTGHVRSKYLNAARSLPVLLPPLFRHHIQKLPYGKCR